LAVQVVPDLHDPGYYEGFLDQCSVLMARSLPGLLVAQPPHTDDIPDGEREQRVEILALHHVAVAEVFRLADEDACARSNVLSGRVIEVLCMGQRALLRVLPDTVAILVSVGVDETRCWEPGEAIRFHVSKERIRCLPRAPTPTRMVAASATTGSAPHC
jgi:hypothetical protein